MRQRRRGDLLGGLMWLVIIGVVVGGGLMCWSNLRRIDSPEMRANYWNENMYPYRGDMERGDRLLEEGRHEAAIDVYTDTIDDNPQNRRSSVLCDRLARACFRHGLALHEEGRWAEAADAFQAADTAVGRASGNAQGVRSYNNTHADEVTRSDAVIDARVESLVMEGVRLRDRVGNLPLAETPLLRAREHRPAHFRTNVELITLRNQREHLPTLLEAMRHFLNLRLEGASSDQLAYRQSIEQRHRELQNHLLQTTPVERWVPLADGMALQCQETFYSQRMGERRGVLFTRHVREASPGVFHIGRNPANPDIIISWQGDMLTEIWTRQMTREPDQTFRVLPRRPVMGMSWPNGDSRGNTWSIVDLVYDPAHEIRLVIRGWHLKPFELTLDIGRTSGTHYAESGDYLISILSAPPS